MLRSASRHALGLLALAVALAGVHPATSAAASPARPDRIVLVSIDGLAGEWASPSRMPVLASLLGRGDRCERATTPALLTVPATGALLTGRAVWPAADPTARSADASSAGPALAPALAGRGYHGLALPADPLTHGETGLGEGFARFAADSPALADSARVDSALAWLARPGRRFVWLALSFGEARDVWRREDGPAFADSGARAARAREIDRALGRLEAGLSRAGLAGGTLLAVAGTHGLPDDSDPGRVPVAFVRLDGSAGRLLPGEASLVDVAPTLVRLAGGGTRGFEGFPLLDGRRPAGRSAVRAPAGSSSPCRDERAVLAGDRSAVPDSATLARLGALVTRCPDDLRVAIEEADALSRAGREIEGARHFVAARERWPDDPTSALAYAQHLIRHQRSALVAGVLAPIPPTSPFAAEAAWLEVAALAEELRFAEATRAAERAAARSVPGPVHARAPAELARLREAERETELHPNDPAVQLEFGRRLADYGIMREAFMRMHRARMADSLGGEPDFWIATYLVRDGRLAPAAVTLERALEREPGHRAARRALAEVLIQLDRWQEAIPHLERVAAEDSTDSVARYNLACLLARDGRSDAALDRLRSALEAGYDNWTQLAEDPDLASLRDLPEFRALMARRPVDR